MRKINTHKYRRQVGASMIEVILATIVIGGMFIIWMQNRAETDSDLKAKQVGQNIEDVTSMFSDYLLANREPLIQAMTDGTNAASWCKTNVNPVTGAGGTVANNTTLHTCAVDFTFLKFKKIVPANYGEVNAYGQRWTAIYRLIFADHDNNVATPDDTLGSVDMLVVGAANGGAEQAAPTNEAILAARIAGSTGGYVPNGQWGTCQYNATARQACSAGGGWRADLSEFLNTP